MKWFTGGIAEAVQYSKQKGAIFVVYVEGNDELSIKITDLINNGEAGHKLGSEHFVAIKIEADSLPHQQFIEIFNERRIPLLYFIGKNGTSLDAITGTDDLSSLSNRIELVLEKAGISTVSPSSSASLIKSEQSAPAENNVVCENGVCSIKGDSPSTSALPNEDDKVLTPEEKVERAKELLQQKREEKEKEEKEKERLREIERRKMGQNVQQMKRWQEDQELKQLREEREREKREKQEARDRVLAQIAQDKAERLAKSSPPQQEPNRPQSVTSPLKPNENSTRIQFKFPDGNISMQEFANSDLLQAVVAHIKSNMNLPYSEFRLSTTFPRREFTEHDYSQTLLDLQLCPTAVILVLPVNSRAVTRGQGGGTFNNFIWSLFAPLLHIFGMIKNFIFGTPNVVGKKTQTGEGSKQQPDNPRQRVRDSTVIKRQGNVHRLSDRRDSDEDGNTWNGNSTQQM